MSARTSCTDDPPSDGSRLSGTGGDPSMIARRETMHLDEARAPLGMRLYAIGDIHGCLDQLRALHALIRDEIERDAVPDWRIVHLGDYVDRGPDARGVLSFLSEARARDSRNVMLAGNHDIGFLEFLDTPSSVSLFARFGGADTARSYGVDLDFSNPARLDRSHAQLLRAMSRSHVDFLVSLDFSASFGDFFFCHAGIKPTVPLEKQDAQQLIWIREEFLDYPQLHPKVVVHGHTPCRQPEVLPNRVNVDTGCYQSGVLTAFAVEGAEKRFLAVGR